MPKKTIQIYYDFRSKAGQLEGTRAKIDNLFNGSNIDFPDLTQTYAGLFLDLFTEFESSLETIFFGLLCGEYYSNNVQRKVKFQPVLMTKEIILAGRQYLDWLPYTDYTLKRAKMFFVDGRPFSYLTDDQKYNLTTYHIIRNAIAHKSGSSQDKFSRFISSQTLSPRERSPSGYLTSRPYGPAGQTQYEIAALELENIAHSICT